MAEDSRRNVYAGDLEVRPTSAPTIAVLRRHRDRLNSGRLGAGREIGNGGQIYNVEAAMVSLQAHEDGPFE